MKKLKLFIRKNKKTGELGLFITIPLGTKLSDVLGMWPEIEKARRKIKKMNKKSNLKHQ